MAIYNVSRIIYLFDIYVHIVLIGEYIFHILIVF